MSLSWLLPGARGVRCAPLWRSPYVAHHAADNRAHRAAVTAHYALLRIVHHSSFASIHARGCVGAMPLGRNLIDRTSDLLSADALGHFRLTLLLLVGQPPPFQHVLLGAIGLGRFDQAVFVGRIVGAL